MMSFLSFLWPIVLGGLGVAAVCGPLGAFIIWRRMAYFGDTLAHSALLGVALGGLWQANLTVSVVVCCVLLSLLLVVLQQQKQLATDTLLGLLAHSTLALGLIVLSVTGSTANVLGFLFGDLLTVTPSDLWLIFGGGGAALLLLCVLWRPLLAMTVHEELAEVEGVPVMLVRLLFMGLLAFVISMAIKIVGILLITSLMIIPAATASQIARSPEQMAFQSAGFGCVGVLVGLSASLWLDCPAGPAIILANFLLFLMVFLYVTGVRERSVNR